MSSFRERIMPWTCAACGKQHISANLTACPQCHAARGETVAPPPVPVEEPKQLVRVYNKGDVAKAFAKDAEQLARQGWRVQSQTAGGQTSNVGKALLFGPLALAAGRKLKEMTVVYVRD